MVIVAPIFVNATQVVCEVPNSDEFYGWGMVELTVDNGNNWSDCDEKYFYMKYPIITSIVPLHGPVTGGTTVTIYGTFLDYLTNSDQNYGYGCCIFGNNMEISDYITHYTVINDTTIQCNTPTYWERSVAIEISPNCGSKWIDYTSHQYLFHFYQNPTLLSKYD